MEIFQELQGIDWSLVLSIAIPIYIVISVIVYCMTKDLIKGLFWFVYLIPDLLEVFIQAYSEMVITRP